MGKKKKEDMTLYNGIMSAYPMISQSDRPKIEPGRNIPDDMILDIEDSGVFLGLDIDNGKGYYVGKRSINDGNILVMGINGSGKNRFLVQSTIRTWRDPMVVLDIKGELSNCYMRLKRTGAAKRPDITFDPANDGVHYDVYELLERNDPHFVQYVREIAYAITPMPLDAREPYWINMARDFLSGAIVYCFDKGYDFIRTILLVQASPAADLCKEIMSGDCILAKTFISEISSLTREQQAAIGTDVKQHTMIFATDPNIQYALSQDEDNSGSFSCKDIVMSEDAPNIFLCLDQSRLEQWSGVIRLMITQLIRQIKRRPEKHSFQGSTTKPLLLLLDEFPLLGRMEAITEAMTTLRLKKVTLYIVIQSIAQLDAVYGPDVRKILVDNCQYKAILQATEPETQEYLSRMIGTVPTAKISVSQIFNSIMERSVWEAQVQEIREPLIYPHEFSTNRDIWLHTPYGFLSTIKLPSTVTDQPVIKFNEAIAKYWGRFKNENQAKEAKKRLDNRRLFIIGELFCKHFPIALEVAPGRSAEEDHLNFECLDNFIEALAKGQQCYQEIENTLLEKTMQLHNVGSSWNYAHLHTRSRRNPKGRRFMEVISLHVDIISRREGRSSVQMAAYCSRSKMLDGHTGWANACNVQFRQHGIDKEVTCLSYAKQGIDREPTKHLGARVRAMESRGIPTNRGNDNRRIMAERQRQSRQHLRQRINQNRTRSIEKIFEPER